MNDRVICRICGKSLRSVNGLHLRTHGITTAQYREQFPDASFHSLKTRENILKGSKPAIISKKLKAAWADPESVFNSEGYRRKKSKAGKVAWASPDSGFNSDQRRKKLSIGIKAAWRDGKYNSLEVRTRMSEAQKLAWSEGKYSSRKATRPDMCGPGNPNWNGGSSLGPYPVEFSNEFKQMIRGRDGNVCAICRLLEPSGNELSVHHIDYNKEDTTPRNCISLCNACHMVTNFNREYWQQELSKLASIREEQWPVNSMQLP